MLRPFQLFRNRLAWLATAGICLGGCAPDKKIADKPGGGPREPVEVKLLVVDDPAMSAAIAGLRAEWNARTGGSIAIAETTGEKLLAADALPEPADAIIYPDAQLAALAQRGWLAPLPEGFADNRELAWSDTFELLQIAATKWGEVHYAIPFGSPVLTLYYRTDLLAELHKQPPRTWSEYRELARTLGRRENLGDKAPPDGDPWFAIAEPLAAGWASGTFLARAAGYARHRDHYSTLFDIETMEPLIAGPAFVRALEELVTDAKLGPPNGLEFDPSTTRREFLAGRVALALAWPGHAGVDGDMPPAEPPPTGFAELPGSTEVYNTARESWEKRHQDDSSSVPLLGLSGRMGSVTSTAAQPTAAFGLLAWLSGREWGPTVSSASPATTLYRSSQTRAPQPWLDPLTNTQAAEQYATSVYEALSHPNYLFALRIPGHAQYLAALDTVVRQAVGGEKTPRDALTEAAAQWRQITETLGVDAQRKAYRLSMVLEP